MLRTTTNLAATALKAGSEGSKPLLLRQRNTLLTSSRSRSRFPGDKVDHVKEEQSLH